MRFFISLIIILNSAFCFAQEAEFSFEEPYQKLDKVTEGELVKMSFPFKNIGTAPLFITKYTVPCNCTRVRFPLKPVAPMASDTVFVFFDSEGKRGLQDRTIKLFANTAENPTEIRFRLAVKKR